MPRPSKNQLPKYKYYRILEMKPAGHETFSGYRVEYVITQGDKVIEHGFATDKPNLFEYAQYEITELVDPRNTK